MAKNYYERKFCPILKREISFSTCIQVQAARDDTMNFLGLEIDFEEDAAACEVCRWFEIDKLC